MTVCKYNTCVKLFDGFGIGVAGSTDETWKHFLYHPEKNTHTRCTMIVLNINIEHCDKHTQLHTSILSSFVIINTMITIVGVAV